MQIWQHSDLCLSVGKINAYRNKKMWKEARQWAKELQGKLTDLQQFFTLQEENKTGIQNPKIRV